MDVHKNKAKNRTKNVRFYPFSCTGKERDEETGYGYFGARYMDHELMTMWLSVDPMADKYPSISPYAYYNWNPIKQLDPDGMEAIECDDWYIDAKGHVQWDANVHSQDDLNNGETYLGQTVTMMAEGSDIATFGDQNGNKLSSVPLNDVTITAPRIENSNPGWVDDASYGVSIVTTLAGGGSELALKNTYPDKVPLKDAKIAKGFNAVGKAMGVVGAVSGIASAGVTLHNALDDGHISFGEGLRMGIQLGAAGTSLVPGVGTVVSLGLSAVDFFFGDAIEKIGSN